MAKFLDGPAAGVSLSLRRAPMLLRVVQNRETKTWDALDQLTDSPADNEDIYLYYIHPESFFKAHVCRSPRRLSGWLEEADYSLLPATLLRIDEEILRDQEVYAAWCEKIEDIMREWIANKVIERKQLAKQGGE